MATNFTRGRGKLYNINDTEFVCTVSYQVHEELGKDADPLRWWGELTFVDKVDIIDGDRYVLELEDKRKGRCSLRRRINKAIISVPPRFYYLFQGTSPLS